MLLLNVSIVVPTRNRRDDLQELLDSISNQTALPKEVIVVDDSDDDGPRELVEKIRDNFLSIGISLKYLRGDEKNKSISAARNIGAKNSSGDIICFLDDDVILDKDFIKQTLEVYNTCTDAKGVQGYIANTRLHSVFSNALNRVCLAFPRDFLEQNKCRAFPFSYPYPLTRVIECEWLVGADSSYKREIFKQFEFDINLKGFSLCEDVDLSYRIRKRFPHSLYMSPHARLIHKNSPVARSPVKDLANILVAYPCYFFYKNVSQTLKNNLIFYWGFFVGRFVSKLVVKNPNEIRFLAKATLKTLRHLEEIRDGNLNFINAPTLKNHTPNKNKIKLQNC
jgi:glycosyltransferase involved in cell wall biosynthesis